MSYEVRRTRNRQEINYLIGWGIGILISLALIAGVVIGGWQLGWWFKAQNTNRTTNIQRHSNQYVTSYITAVDQDIDSIRSIDVQMADPSYTPAQKSGLQGERIAIVNDACHKANLIPANDVPQDIATFMSTDCH